MIQCNIRWNSLSVPRSEKRKSRSLCEIKISIKRVWADVERAFNPFCRHLTPELHFLIICTWHVRTYRYSGNICMPRQVNRHIPDNDERDDNNTDLSLYPFLYDDLELFIDTIGTIQWQERTCLFRWYNAYYGLVKSDYLIITNMLDFWSINDSTLRDHNWKIVHYKTFYGYPCAFLIEVRSDHDLYRFI